MWLSDDVYGVVPRCAVVFVRAWCFYTDLTSAAIRLGLVEDRSTVLRVSSLVILCGS